VALPGLRGDGAPPLRGRGTTDAVLHPELVQRLIDVYGDVGREWVAVFPALLERVRRRWGLTLGETFDYVGYAYVVRAELPDGTPAVLKLAPPEKELVSEIVALRHYNGEGICRLIDADETEVALLLERLEPGATLSTLGDDVAATEIAANVMRRLFKTLPPGHAFPTLDQWGQAFHRVREKYNGGCGAFPADLFQPAFDLYFSLCTSSPEPVLLHGDLHHYNILSATREPWLAIDPKGLAGDPAFDVGPYLYNCIEGVDDLREYTLRRIGQFSDILGIDRQRLLAWGFAEALLSRLWNFEDNGEVNERDHLRVARALLPLI
jgi:streptomycin 6-kinase